LLNSFYFYTRYTVTELCHAFIYYFPFIFSFIFSFCRRERGARREYYFYLFKFLLFIHLCGLCDLSGEYYLFYSITSVTTPAPTVLPPSLIANLTSFSIAIGAISSIVSVTLSPGITISTPSGSSATPVTSVVLK